MSTNNGTKKPRSETIEFLIETGKEIGSIALAGAFSAVSAHLTEELLGERTYNVEVESDTPPRVTGKKSHKASTRKGGSYYAAKRKAEAAEEAKKTPTD